MRAAAAGLALAGAVTTASCSVPTPGVAARVQGQEIPEQAIDDIAADFASVQGAQVPQRSQIAFVLIARPFVQQALGAQASRVSTASVRSALAQQLPDPSPATVEFFHTQQLAQQFDERTSAAFQKAMTTADVQVNPKYGTWAPDQGGLTPYNPDWLAKPFAAPNPAG